MTGKSCNVDPMILPNYSEIAISGLTMKPVTLTDDHSPVLPHPTKHPSVEDVEQDSESDEDDFDTKFCQIL